MSAGLRDGEVKNREHHPSLLARVYQGIAVGKGQQENDGDSKGMAAIRLRGGACPAEQAFIVGSYPEHSKLAVGNHFIQALFPRKRVVHGVVAGIGWSIC
jgi:hypothetical protein